MMLVEHQELQIMMYDQKYLLDFTTEVFKRVG